MNLDFLKRRDDEGFDDFLARFRSGVKNLERDEVDLLIAQLRYGDGASYAECCERFETIYKFSRPSQDGKNNGRSEK